MSQDPCSAGRSPSSQTMKLSAPRWAQSKLSVDHPSVCVVAGPAGWHSTDSESNNVYNACCSSPWGQSHSQGGSFGACETTIIILRSSRLRLLEHRWGCCTESSHCCLATWFTSGAQRRIFVRWVLVAAVKHWSVPNMLNLKLDQQVNTDNMWRVSGKKSKHLLCRRRPRSHTANFLS